MVILTGAEKNFDKIQYSFMKHEMKCFMFMKFSVKQEQKELLQCDKKNL